MEVSDLLSRMSVYLVTYTTSGDQFYPNLDILKDSQNL